MMNKTSVILCSDLADFLTSLAEDTLNKEEANDLYQSAFDYYMSIIKTFDSKTIETMDTNFHLNIS